jgi:hypothetical protein
VILSFLFGDSVDSILASFQRTITRLDRLQSTAHDKAAKKHILAQELLGQAASLKAEATRAHEVAFRLRELIK